MKYNFNFIVLGICTLFVQCQNKNLNIAPVKKVTDEYFGHKVVDPYRYMENLDDSTVIQWFKNQDKETKGIIHKISGRERLFSAIQKSSYSVPSTSMLRITDGNDYYYLKREPNENITKLYTRNGFNGKEELLFDPGKYDSKEEYLINYIQPSWDASKVVIGLTKEDEEFSTLVILDLTTKTLLPDKLKHSWPSALGGVEWLPDNTGFIYTYIPDINSKSDDYLSNSRAIIHKVGQSPKKSQEILSMHNNPEINFKKEDFPLIYIINSDNRYIFGEVAGVSRYRDTYYAPVNGLMNNNMSWKLLFEKKDKIRGFYLSGNDLYFLSAKNASNFKICKTSLDNPNFESPDILVEEDPKAVISDFTLTKKGLFYVKTTNGVNAKLYWLKNNETKNVPLPKISGYINVSSKGPKYNDLWVEIEGWTTNKQRYYYNIDDDTFIKENLSPVVAYPELEDVTIEEIEIPSYDGEKVPLSIIYKKGIQKNGKNRVLLNGYGAYKWSNSPYLYPYLLHWIKEGGIYAVAHVRGGGEKGDIWHKSGFKTTKPNTWKDFIACTEYLINEGYTTNRQMAAWGASAGGIAIGRAITERPDLYAAAFIRVGLLNTLRLEFAPNGLSNTKEFGTVKDSIEFEALFEMDPYHHIKKGVEYPAIYLTAGMNDARIAAWQPGKFAARMQAATASHKPVLLDVDFTGGHGFETDENKKNEELVNILSFALWQTGHPNYQLK